MEINIEKFYKNVEKYFEKYDEKELVEYIIKTNQANKIILDADNIINNYIYFDDIWDMEQCKQKYKVNFNSWNKTPNGDEEWVYMFNRMGFIENLILAYYITLNEKYINKWKQIVQKWIDINDVKVKKEIKNNSSKIRKINLKVVGKLKTIFKLQNLPSSIRTLDTAMRCVNIINGMMHLVKLKKIDKNFQIKVLESIKLQIELIKIKYRKFEDISNWGIIEMTPIMIAIIIISDTSDKYYIWAKQKLEKQLKIQILEDGSNIEGSPMYHNQILLYMLKLVYWHKKFQYPIKEEFVDIINKMMEYTYYIATPDYKQLEVGDSDRTDISDLIYIYNTVMNEKKYMQSTTIKAYYKYYFYKAGGNLNENIENLSKTVKKFKNGNIVIKQKGEYTFLNNGDLFEIEGTYSGHRHADTGHFIIYNQGKPFLVDSGRYTYIDNEKRKYLKSEFAHNTIIIDEKPFSIIENSWQYKTFTKTILNDVEEFENIVVVKMEYYGFDDKCKISRKFFVFDEGIWVIVDNIEFMGRHKCKKLYHYDTKVELEEEANVIKASNNGSILYMINNNIDNRIIKNSFVSLNYNEITNNKEVITEKNFEDNLTSIDVLYDKEASIKMKNNNIIIKTINHQYKIDNHNKKIIR